MAASARSAAGSASAPSRSPKARLPIWSWFCRKLTKAERRQVPLRGSPRGAPLGVRAALAL